jgi:hypothetical protein
MDARLGSGEGRAHMKRLMPVLTLLLITLALGVGSAAGQGEPDEGEGGGGIPLCGSDLSCNAQVVQDIVVTYKYGFAIYVYCHNNTPRAPDCPDVKDVDVKATVLPSVAKILHSSSTTITAGPTAARLGKDVNVPDPNENFDKNGHYYFVQLKPAIERRMKAIKVRSLGMTLSGVVTRPDGSKFNVKSDELGVTAFQGNCQGRSLRIKRRITYGGRCIPF